MDWHIQRLNEIKRALVDMTCRAFYYQRVMKKTAPKWANLKDDKVREEVQVTAQEYVNDRVGEILDRSPINITEAMIMKAEPYSIVIVKTQRPLTGEEMQHMVDFFASHGRDDLALMNFGPNDTVNNLRRDQAKHALSIVLGLEEQARKVGSGEITHTEFDDELSKVLDDDDFDNY